MSTVQYVASLLLVSVSAVLLHMLLSVCGLGASAWIGLCREVYA
jgi:hypothetical protein